MSRVISARLPDAILEEVEARLVKHFDNGDEIALKTKGKFREYRISDVIVDMLGDAIIKEEVVEDDFFDRVEQAIASAKDGDSHIGIKIDSVEDSESVQKIAFKFGYGWIGFGTSINYTTHPRLVIWPEDKTICYGTEWEENNGDTIIKR